jgi:hypothetical protein
MTATLSTNGQVRKNLASPLDRLDGILDGLADGLNEAVVTAVQAAVGLAVQEAVRAVLSEVLTHPELLDPLRGRAAAPAPVAAAAPVPAAAEPIGARLTRRLGRLANGVGAGLRAACRAGVRTLHRARAGAAAVHARLHAVRRFRGQLLTALAVGAVLGVATYFAGPWLAAAAGGAGGFATTVLVQAGLVLRRHPCRSDERATCTTSPGYSQAHDPAVPRDQPAGPARSERAGSPGSPAAAWNGPGPGQEEPEHGDGR